MALDLDRVVSTHRLVDEEKVLQLGLAQLGYVRMLLVLVPASSIIFGMALRLAVTYASRYFRDRWVYRVVVPVLSVLATGSIAAQVALVFQTVTVIVERSSTHLDRSPITVLAQVCATAMSIIARGFFISRMYELNKSPFILSTAIFLWLAATAFLLAWEVDYSNPKLVIGSPITWANIGSWSLFVGSAFVSAVLFRELRSLLGRSLHTLSVRDRAAAYAKIWVESSGLLAVAYLASSLTQAIKDGSAVARLTSIWTFLIVPLVAIFSVMFSLVSRPSPPSVTPRSSTMGSRSRTKRSNSALSRSRNGGGGADLFSLQRMRCSGARDVDDDDHLPPVPAMLETNSVSRPVRGGGGAVLPDAAARAAGPVQPDDPRTWRGDAGRLFPALQFDPAHSLSTAGRSSTLSASFQGTTDFDTFSLPQVAALRRESSTPILGRSPTTSSIQHASSTQQQHDGAGSAPTLHEAAEYDEALVDLHPTVASLDLDAFETCNPLVWGPRRRAADEEQEQGVRREPERSPPSASSPS
ncbi:hypothetical protein JCM3775_001709 [Rhodotorula graminis]